ncbi:MAG: thioredoxin [Lachnospiraceae bacterium]|nr:thioredoxin [Lachnospiraceae bacterium]
MATLQITKEEFEKEVIQADIPVVVDFWAEWCGPCKMLGPVVEMVSDEVENVKFCKVNIDEAMELALKYQITNIPTLVLFKNGEVDKRSVGVISKDEIIKFIS